MDKLWIEVAYASPTRQRLVRLPYKDMTVEQAIERSGILSAFPDIDLARNKVGIFGRQVRLSYRLRPGNRVEIYRPLHLSPTQARRRRVRAE